jgi:hypothetical protein
LVPSYSVNSNWGRVLPTSVPIDGCSTTTATPGGAAVAVIAVGSPVGSKLGLCVASAAFWGKEFAAVEESVLPEAESAVWAGGISVPTGSSATATEGGLTMRDESDSGGVGASVAEVPLAKIAMGIAINVSSRSIRSNILTAQTGGHSFLCP